MRRGVSVDVKYVKKKRVQNGTADHAEQSNTHQAHTGIDADRQWCYGAEYFTLAHTHTHTRTRTHTHTHTHAHTRINKGVV